MDSKLEKIFIPLGFQVHTNESPSSQFFSKDPASHGRQRSTTEGRAGNGHERIHAQHLKINLHAYANMLCTVIMYAFYAIQMACTYMWNKHVIALT